jgi:hypothetical protein
LGERENGRIEIEVEMRLGLPREDMPLIVWRKEVTNARERCLHGAELRSVRKHRLGGREYEPRRKRRWFE